MNKPKIQQPTSSTVVHALALVLQIFFSILAKKEEVPKRGLYNPHMGVKGTVFSGGCGFRAVFVSI